MTRTEAARVASALLLTWFLASSNVSAQSCPGDCSGDLAVTINELIACVNIALGTSLPEACLACDTSGDGTVMIDELIESVRVALGLFTVTAEGTCQRPGPESLESCVAGTMVQILRCDDRARCLDDPDARTLLDATIVGRGGAFSLTIDGCEAANAVLIFEAEVDPETDTTYRLLDFGSVTPVGNSMLASLGRGSGVLEHIVIGPISEAAVRLLEEIGLDNFDDAGVLEIIEAVEEANAQTVLAGVPASDAADRATETARGDAGVQAAIRNNQFTLTPTLSPEPTITKTSTRHHPLLHPR